MSSSPSLPEEEIVRLRPEELRLNPRYNVRPYSVAADGEDRRVEQLARSIERDGQQDPIRITPDYEVICGHRRRRAVIMANSWRTSKGQGLLKLTCIVDHSSGDLRRKAIASNVHRRDVGMDLAMLITQIRHEYHWESPSCTRHVADYLMIDVSTVLQHELLHRVPSPTQKRLHEGEISIQTALLLNAKVPPEAQPQVLQRAREVQDSQKLEKLMGDFQAGKATLTATTKRLQSPSENRIQHPAVVKAIRDMQPSNASLKSPTRSRKELILDLETLDCDDVPEQGRLFIRYVCQAYTKGEGDPKDLKSRYIACFRGVKTKAS